MQIHLNNIYHYGNYHNKYKTQTNTQNNYISQKLLTNDVISFKAEKKNVLNDLKDIGLVGAPFLLSLATATYLFKKQNPEEIFLSDGTYLCNTKDLSLKTDIITADADDGIFKIKNSKIYL